MKKLFLLLCSLVAFSLTGNAQERLLTIANQPTSLSKTALSSTSAIQQAPSKALSATERAVGYTDGDSITRSSVYFGKAGTYTVGALVESNMLSYYVGCKIVGVRFALSQSIGNTKVFLKRIDETQGITTELVKKSVHRTSEGWNEVRFNAAQEHTIANDEGFLFGFDYTETEEMATSKKGALCCYGKELTCNNAFLKYRNHEFFGVKGSGNLCVQLIVDVSNLPSKQVTPLQLLSGNKYQKPGAQLDAFLSYSNVGRDSISSCRFGYRFDNGSVTYFESNQLLAPGKSGSAEQMITFPSSLTTGVHQLQIFVDQIDGEVVLPTATDTLSNTFVVYRNGMKRQQHYVEQYTSQESASVPFSDALVSSLDNDANICLVNIHQPNTSLSLDASNYLNDLYAYTYPCFTVDRFYFMGERYIAFDFNDYVQVLPSLATDAIRNIVAEAENTNPAFATVDIAPSYDETTGQLSVTVSGDVSTDVSAIFGNMALTVMLAEDNVVAPQLTYRGSGGATFFDNSYVHNQVLRAYMTSPIGDELTVTGNHYTVNYTTTLDSSWKLKDLKVVALVTKAVDAVTDENVLDVDVTNCNSCKLADALPNGISQTVTTPSHPEKVYYTLDGMCISEQQLRSGVYILQQGTKRTKIVVRK